MPVPSREPFSICGIQYQILDRRLAEVTTADVPYGVITVTGSERSHVRVPESSNRLGLLQLKFDDIPYEIDDMVLFSHDHALQVLDFYDKMVAQGAKRLIINCEMGRCRSAAIGAGLAEATGHRAAWFDRRFQPNAHVRSVMVEAARQRQGKMERR